MMPFGYLLILDYLGLVASTWKRLRCRTKFYGESKMPCQFTSSDEKIWSTSWCDSRTTEKQTRSPTLYKFECDVGHLLNLFSLLQSMIKPPKKSLQSKEERSTVFFRPMSFGHCSTKLFKRKSQIYLRLDDLVAFMILDGLVFILFIPVLSYLPLYLS